MRAEVTLSVMQMGLLLGRPRGTLGRKSKYWFKEFYNSLFGDLVNPEKLFFIGNRNFEVLGDEGELRKE